MKKCRAVASAFNEKHLYIEINLFREIKNWRRRTTLRQSVFALLRRDHGLRVAGHTNMYECRAVIPPPWMRQADKKTLDLSKKNTKIGYAIEKRLLKWHLKKAQKKL